MAVAMLILAVGSGLLSAARKNAAPTARNIEKAKYYNRQAFKYQDSTDIVYEMARHAIRLDPASVEAGYNFGLYHMIMGRDSTERNRGMQLVRRYADTYPADYTENNLYSMMAARVMDQPQEAVRVLERLLTIYPKRTDIYMSLANYYGTMGESEAALNAVRRYEHAETMDVNTVVTKSAILLSRTDTAEAILAIDSLVMAKPNDPETWMLRGEFYGILEQPDSALASLLRARDLAPYQFRTRMMLADFYRQQGDSVQADARMTEALAANDLTVEEKADGLTEFVSGLVANGNDLTRALPMIEALENQDPGNRAVLSIKAALFNTMERYDDLIATLRRMLAEAPDNAELWNRLMFAHISKEDYKSLPAIHREAEAELGHTDPVLDLYLASGYAMDNNPGKAAEILYGTIHSYIPTYSDTMPGQALADTVETRNFPVNIATYLQMLGDQYVSLNDTVKGLRVYDQALRIEPDNYMTLNNYAYFLALGGKELDRALEMSQKTVNAQPSNGTFLDTYAYILFRKHEYDRARMYQEMAIQATPEAEVTPDLYEHYGDILFMLGDAEKAVEYWKKALAKSPDNDLLKRKVEHETYFYK